MTGKERVLAALNGEPFDVYPAANITSVATIDAMKYVKAFFPEAHTDGTKMADLAAVAHDLYGFDSVAPYFSIHLEAASLGCPVNWADRYTMPYVTKPPLHNLDEMNIPKDILNRPLLRQLLRACKILKKRYDGTVAVIGKVVGPWTLAYHLRGVENFLLDTTLEPKKARKAETAAGIINLIILILYPITRGGGNTTFILHTLIFCIIIRDANGVEAHRISPGGAGQSSSRWIMRREGDRNAKEYILSEHDDLEFGDCWLMACERIFNVR